MEVKGWQAFSASLLPERSSVGLNELLAPGYVPPGRLNTEDATPTAERNAGLRRVMSRATAQCYSAALRQQGDEPRVSPWPRAPTVTEAAEAGCRADLKASVRHGARRGTLRELQNLTGRLPPPIALR